MLLGFLLLPITLARSVELRIGDHVARVDENTLKSIRRTENSSSNELNLSSLGLDGIDKNAFNDLEYIKVLDLSNNSLSNLPDFVFANLTSLEHLSLADNAIEDFANTFVGLTYLKFLNISNNPIRHLRDSHFFGLTKLCDISTNNLWSISTSLFENPFLRDEKLAQEIAKAQAVVKDKGTKKKITAVNSGETIVQTRSVKVPRKNLRAKVCIEDGSVKLLDVLSNGENLPVGCSAAKVDYENDLVDLRNLGIARFESGWYRLRGSTITKIRLDNNNIVRVTKDILNDLPKEVTQVSLSDNKIERLVKGVIVNEHLKSLNFKGNIISDIEDGALENTNLTGLHILGNLLTSTKFAATLPSTLNVLTLTDNQITDVVPGSFARLNKLQFVSLVNNKITQLKSRSFSGLTSLQMLPLDNNGLKNIEPGAFQGLKSVMTMSLNNNSIDYLAKGVFAGLEKIETIYLIRNKLRNITQDSLEGTEDTLEALHLQFNAIETLKAGTFVNVPKDTLSLFGNKISKIEKGAFDSSTLRDLTLSNNLLEDFDGDSFEGLRNLRYLHLNNNLITKIDRGAAKNLSSLYFLDITKNPIERLENGALFGLPKSKGSYVILTDVPIQIIQGGLFDE